MTDEQNGRSSDEVDATPPEDEAEEPAHDHLPVIDQPEHELTPDQAREALEAAGVRCGVDEAGNVVKVFVNRTPLTDAQLWPIKYLPTVEVVNLSGTQIGDEGLRYLHNLPNLRRIYPAQSQVSERGLDELQQARPEVGIAR